VTNDDLLELLVATAAAVERAVGKVAGRDRRARTDRAGQYAIDLNVKDGRHGEQIDQVEGAASFTILEADVFGTGYRLTHHDGLLALDFEWQVQPGHLDELAPDRAG